MLVRCPVCTSKSRISASEQMGEETRYLYCQCLNLNCSSTFRASISIDHVIKTPEQGSEPPDPEKQPELLKDPRQMDLLAAPAESA
ncbi:MAG: ogr/Delta-like zinc finger family protein [Hydrogenovibrio crunogenus]|nr:ogr/Delta-like zinc finger family protein [Hydrogenovibrio crunogenus]